MSNAVYARAAVVPDALYLTAGKLYAVEQDGEPHFTITDDDGDVILCLWGGCAHLDDGSWERVTEDSLSRAKDPRK